MEVYRLPVLSDNYVFVLHDRATNIAAVVDPAVPQPVLAKLHELNAPLVAIFNTHHHYDHIGANQTLLSKFPELVIHGGELDRGRIPGQQIFLKDGDRVQFGAETAEVFFVPGHTRAHIAYYFPESGNLFCGDTLFAGGCGRLFEGTPAQMMHSLARLRQLPEATKVWCAHEYTLNNLQFAITVDRHNQALRERLVAVQEARTQGKATIPTTIGLEKQTNPFMRWDQPALQEAAKINDPVRVFARIRGKKDLF
jgi:hydroxyacylglutathione hydrolase